MSEYREGRKGSPELEALARAGRAAREDADDVSSRAAAIDGERHLREALASIYGAPTNLMVRLLGGFALMAGLVMVMMNQSVPAPLGAATVALGILLAVAGGVMSPKAPLAGVEEERKWARSHPFALEGYFEVLSAKPRASGGVRAHVTWKGEGPDVEGHLLADAIAAADPGARVERNDAAEVVFVSGKIDGTTGSSVNRVPVVRNHRYPDHVHALVDKVLVPLSRRHPIERVRLEPV